MSILEGLFFGSQVPFDEVNMEDPEYYRACDRVSECKSTMVKQHPDLAQLMEDFDNALMEQIELSRYHEFSVGVRVGAQLMIEMLKAL